MPSTAYNITQIKAGVQNYSREQIRDALNEIQMIVFDHPSMQNTKISSATGLPPFLATTQGTREYACPADCKETLNVFWEIPPQSYTPFPRRAMYSEYVYRGSSYYKIAVNSTNALYDTLATVTFVDDPGTTTDKYFHEYITKPVAVTSETIQLSVGEETHYLLRQAVIAMMSTENYGQTGFDTSVIENTAKKIRTSLNRGAQPRSYSTPIREEFRDEDYGYTGY